MAPKRKADKYAYVDLTQEQDDDDNVIEVPKKRQRRPKKSAEDETGAGPSQQPESHAGAPKPKGKRSPGKNSSQEETQVALEAVLAAAPPKPKGRKKAQSDEERRVSPSGATVAYRPQPSQKVQERIARAMPGSGHRMFLVDSTPLRPPGAEGGAAAEYHVLGATGNVYRVQVSRHPHCSCPDFDRGHLCKHWLFVLLRVLRRSQDDPLIWQRALLPSEVNTLLGQGPGAAGGAAAADPSVLAGERVRQRFAQLTGAAGGASAEAAGGAAGGGGVVQRPVEGDCPICYDELGGEAVTFCRACGNNMHVECFRKWSSSRSSHGQAVTCVLCRAPWQAEGGAGAGGSGPSRYLNLAAYSEAHAGGGPSLDALYGSTAVFVRANQGGLSRRAALQHYMAEQGLA